MYESDWTEKETKLVLSLDEVYGYECCDSDSITNLVADAMRLATTGLTQQKAVAKAKEALVALGRLHALSRRKTG